MKRLYEGTKNLLIHMNVSADYLRNILSNFFECEPKVIVTNTASHAYEI